MNPKSVRNGIKLRSAEIGRKNLSRFTYMDDVTVLVDHEVAIVAVFDLQQEHKDAVGSHRSDEVLAGGAKLLAAFVPKLFLEVSI